MRQLQDSRSTEEGFILVTALLILLVMTIIGIAATRNTTTELLIAGNDKVYKETFFNADGGVDVAQELLEQNIACIDGFTINYNDGTESGCNIDNFAFVPGNSRNFWLKSLAVPLLPPDDLNRDMYFPYYATDPQTGNTSPHTNITVGGNNVLNTGSNMLGAMGYHGKGYSLGEGGTSLWYIIRAMHLGTNNSEALVRIQYRHVIGTESTKCYY